MAIIKCPECGREVSNKSKVCIHCGFPISEMIEEEEKKNSFVMFGKWYINSLNEKELIPWIVLQENPNEVLLLSLYGLKFKEYNDKFENCFWETCSLRKWLNEDFYKEAFSSIDLTKMFSIKRTNPYTQKLFFDSVSLLSIDEAKLLEHDFVKCIPTLFSQEEAQKEYNNGWWLLEPNVSDPWTISKNGSTHTAICNQYGALYPDCGIGDDGFVLVRPIIKIKNDNLMRKKFTTEQEDSEGEVLMRAENIVKTLCNKYSDDHVADIIDNCITLSVKFDESKIDSKFEMINILKKNLNTDNCGFDKVTFKFKCMFEQKEDIIQKLNEKYSSNERKLYYELILLACGYNSELTSAERNGLYEIAFMNN